MMVHANIATVPQLIEAAVAKMFSAPPFVRELRLNSNDTLLSFDRLQTQWISVSTHTASTNRFSF